MDSYQCEPCDRVFSSSYEYNRHCRAKHAERRRTWICADPLATDAPYTSQEEWRPIRPIGVCDDCQKRKNYNADYNAAAHMRRMHFCPRKTDRPKKDERLANRANSAAGGEKDTRAGKSGGDWPPLEWLKNHRWIEEVEVSDQEYNSNCTRRPTEGSELVDGSAMRQQFDETQTQTPSDDHQQYHFPETPPPDCALNPGMTAMSGCCDMSVALPLSTIHQLSYGTEPYEVGTLPMGYGLSPYDMLDTDMTTFDDDDAAILAMYPSCTQLLSSWGWSWGS